MLRIRLAVALAGEWGAAWHGPPGPYPTRDKPPSLPASGGPAAILAQATPARLGIFEDHADVGAMQHGGWVRYDESTKSYTVAGSGANLWGTHDAFHFVWKKACGGRGAGG